MEGTWWPQDFPQPNAPQQGCQAGPLQDSNNTWASWHLNDVKLSKNIKKSRAGLGRMFTRNNLTIMGFTHNDINLISHVKVIKNWLKNILWTFWEFSMNIKTDINTPLTLCMNFIVSIFCVNLLSSPDVWHILLSECVQWIYSVNVLSKHCKSLKSGCTHFLHVFMCTRGMPVWNHVAKDVCILAIQICPTYIVVADKCFEQMTHIKSCLLVWCRA